MGIIITFPKDKNQYVKTKDHQNINQFIGPARRLIEGTGKIFPSPTPENLDNRLREILSELLSFSPGKHDNMACPFSRSIRNISGLIAECNLTSERDQEKRKQEFQEK